MFCPNCGKQHIQPNPTTNGGELYVAEEMEGCTEFYDAAEPFKCADCETQFYLGEQ
jgi:predicted RNA-binding Zn-ribbon protein involved in translation (DUF1610 family)